MKKLKLVAALGFCVTGCATINRTLHPRHHEVSFNTEVREKGDRTLPQIKDLSTCKPVQKWTGDLRQSLLSEGYTELDKSFLEDNEILSLNDLHNYSQSVVSRSYRDRDGFVRHSSTTYYDREWADVYRKNENGRSFYKVLVRGHWAHADESRVNCAKTRSFVSNLKDTIDATRGAQAYLYGCHALSKEIGLLTDKTGLEVEKTVKKLNKRGVLTKVEVSDVFREKGRLYVSAKCSGFSYNSDAFRIKVKIPRKNEPSFANLQRGEVVPVGLSKLKSRGVGSYSAVLSKKLSTASIKLRASKQDFSSTLF